MEKQKLHNISKLRIVITIILFFLILISLVLLIKNKSTNVIEEKEGKISESDVIDYLTIEKIKNFEYSFGSGNKKYKLVNGSYVEKFSDSASENYVGIYDEHVIIDDLNNDKMKDAVVIIDQRSGGSGHFYQLTIVLNENEKLLQTASLDLGDRVIINSLEVNEGKIILDMIIHGSRDGSCCPTLRKVFEYELKGSELVKIREKDFSNTANWNLYQSEKYSFEIKYPENFYIEENHSSVWNETKSVITLSDSGKFEDEPYSFLMSIENVEDFAEVADKTKDDETTKLASEKLELEKIKQLLNTEVIGIFFGDPPWGYYLVYVKNPNEANQGFLLTAQISPDNATGYEKNKSDLDLFKEILSTLRFISKDEKMSNWKEYRNEEYGIEFKHPSSWFPYERDIFEMIYFTDIDPESKEAKLDRGDEPNLMEIEIFQSVEKFLSDNNKKNYELSGIKDYLDKYSNFDNQYLGEPKSFETAGIRIYSSEVYGLGGGTFYYFQGNEHLYRIKLSTIKDDEMIEQILSTFKFIESEKEPDGLKTYQSEEFGFEFQYDSRLDISDDGSITVKHSIPFEHENSCDFGQESALPVLRELVDFNIDIEIKNLSIINAIREEEGEYITKYIDDDLLKTEDGYIDEIKIAQFGGYRISHAFEGCGNDAFYFTVDSEKTLFVRRQHIAELIFNPERYSSVEGVIMLQESNEMFNEIISSFKFAE